MKLNENSPQKALMVYLFLGMLPSGIKIFLLPVYVNFLSPSDYGILSILNVFSASYAVLGSFQLNIGAGVHFFKRTNKEAFEKTVISSSLILSFISFAFFLATGPAIFRYLFQIPDLNFYPLGLMVLVTAFLNQTYLVYFVLLKNTYRLKELCFYSVTLVALSSGLQFFLIVFMKLSVMGSVLGGLIAMSFTVLILLVSNRRLLSFNIDRAILRSCLMIGIPMIPSVFIHWVIQNADRILLEKYLSLYDLGIYTLLINILGVSLLITQSLATAIRPVFFSYLQKMKESSLELSKLDRKFTLLTILSASLVLLIGYNLELIISDERYLTIIPYLSVGIFIILPQSLVKLPRLAMTFQGKTGLVSLFTFFNAVIMITLMTLLIPKGGIYFALISIAIASGAELALCYFTFLKLKIPNSYKRNLMTIALTSLLISGICWIGMQWNLSFGLIGIAQFMATITLIYLFERKNFDLKTLLHPAK